MNSRQIGPRRDSLESISLFVIGLLAILTIWAVPLSVGVNSRFFSDQSTGFPKYYVLFQYASHGSYMVWDDSVSLPVAYESYIPRYLMVALFAITKNMLLSLKIASFLLCCLAFAFTFLLAHLYFDDPFPAFLSGLAYASLPFFLGMVNFHFTLAWFYVLLPLSLSSLELVIKRFSVSSLLNAALCMGAVLFLPTPQGPFLLGGFVFLYAGIRFLVVQAGTLPLGPNLLRTLAICTLVGLSSVAVGSFYVFPRLSEYFPYVFPNHIATLRTSLQQFEQNSPSLWQIISTFSYHELSASRHFTYEGIDLPAKAVYLFFFVIAMSSSLIGKKRRSVIVPLLIVSLLSVLLTQGARSGLSNVVMMMRESIPLFNLVRTPDRFLMFACLGCSLLFGITLTDFLTIVDRVRYRLLALLVVITVTVPVTIYSGHVMRTFDMKPYEYIEQVYPHVWEVRDALKNANPNSGYRVVDLSVPVGESAMRGNFYTMGHRFWLNQYEVVERLIRYPDFAGRLGDLNVGAVVLSPPWGFDRRYHGSFSTQVRDVIDSDRNFNKIFDHSITVWENDRVRPRLYTATPIVDFCGPISLAVIPTLQSEAGITTPAMVDPHTIRARISPDLLMQYPYWLTLRATEQLDLIALSHPENMIRIQSSAGQVIEYDYRYRGALTFDFISNNPFLTNSVNERSPLIGGKPVRIPVTTTFSILQSDVYRLAFRVMPTLSEHSDIAIEVDDQTVEWSLGALDWQWVTVTLYLEAGRHGIRIAGHPSNILDAIVIMPDSDYQFAQAEWQTLLQRSRVDEWEVNVQGQTTTLVLHKGQPPSDWMFIVNTETFSPYWRARIIRQKTEFYPVRTNLFVNGFYLPAGSGVSSVEMYYANSPARTIGMTTTLLFVMACLVANLVGLLRNRKRLIRPSADLGLRIKTSRISKRLVFYFVVILFLGSIAVAKMIASGPISPPPIFDSNLVEYRSTMIEEKYHFFGKSLILHLSARETNGFPQNPGESLFPQPF